ncbi:hypothetical protein ACM66B_003058 [Microbotryomycetes sp. NB124-2]
MYNDDPREDYYRGRPRRASRSGYGPTPPVMRPDDAWPDRRGYDYPPPRGYDDRGPSYIDRVPPMADRGYRPDDPYRSRSPTGDLNPRFLPDGRRLDAPDKLDYKVTQRYFKDWLELVDPKTAADNVAFEHAWNEYEISFKRRDVKEFFDSARKDPWFQEKYDSSKSMTEMRAKNKAKGRSGKLQKFLAELDSLGDLSFDYPEHKDANGKLAAEGENGTAKEGESDAKAATAPTNEAEASSDEHDIVDVAGSDCTVLIEDIAPTVTRAELEQICESHASFQYLSMSEPKPVRDYTRTGWAVFGEADKATAAATDLQASKLGVTATVDDKPTKCKTKAAPSLASSSERIAADLDNIRRAALGLEKEEGDSRGSSAIEEQFEQAKAALEQESDEEAKKSQLEALARHTLDVYLHYLRTVFNSCFYCLSTFEFPEELSYKCPKHLRRQLQPNAVRTKPEELTWTRWFDERVRVFADRENVNPLDFGGQDYDTAVESMASAHYKEEEPGKYRCTGCSKLFSAHKFIIKHLFTKHGSIFDQAKLDEIKFFNNYALDPVRLPLQVPFDMFTETGLRERSTASRPLSERLGDKAVDELSSAKKRRRGGPGRENGGGKPLPPPPPPKGVKLDPRASRGVSSYADLDNAPTGASDDIVLQY